MIRITAPLTMLTALALAVSCYNTGEFVLFGINCGTAGACAIISLRAWGF